MYKVNRGMINEAPQIRGKKKGKKKVIIIVVIVAVALMAALIVPAAMGAGESQGMPVNVVAVEEGDITSVLDSSGTVVSLNSKTYYSPVNAALKQYDLKVGSLVKKGDVLVTFETENLERDNEKAELTADATKANNEDLLQKEQISAREAAAAKENITAIQGDINNFESYIDRLNANITNRTQELAADAGVDAANTSSQTAEQLEILNVALANAQLKEGLESSNAQLQIDIDALEIQESQAISDGDTNTATIIRTQINNKEDSIASNQDKITGYKNKMGVYNNMSAAEIQNQIDALTSGSGGYGSGDTSTDAQIAQWQQDLSDAQSTLAELKSDLASEEAKVDSYNSSQMTDAAKKAITSNNNLAELENKSLEELLEEGRKGISAEFDGIIVKAEQSQGAEATQGLELVTVASNRDVAVEATVSKYDFDKLEEGQKATVSIGNKEYRGTVSSISKVAQKNEQGSTFITCEVKIDNPDDDIFLDVEAKVSIITGEEKDAVKVSTQAVNIGKDSTFSYIIRDGKVVRQNIVVGISSADETQILEGLEVGDTVIEELPEGITEGMEVTPVTEDTGDVGQIEAVGEE